MGQNLFNSSSKNLLHLLFKISVSRTKGEPIEIVAGVDGGVHLGMEKVRNWTRESLVQISKRISSRIAVVARERIPANVANKMCDLCIASSNLLQEFLAKQNVPLVFANAGELCRQTWERQRQWKRQRHGAITGIIKKTKYLVWTCWWLLHWIHSSIQVFCLEKGTFQV